MTKFKTIFAVVAAMAILAAGVPAKAEEAAAGLPIGVVDMNKIMRTADAAKGVIDDLESKRKVFQADVGKQEDSLRSMEQDILKQKDSLSKEDFEKKRKEFQDKLSDAQKTTQARKNALDQAFSDSMGKLRNEVLKAAADVAKEKGLKAVFNQEAMLLVDPKFDITDAVIAGMNKNVKKIPVIVKE